MNKIYFHLKKTIECDPSFPDAYIMLAKEYKKDKDIQNYLEYINIALRISKENIKNLDRLKKKYIEKNLFGLARKIFFQQNEQKKQVSSLLVELGIFNVNNKNYSSALNFFLEAKLINPLNADAYFNEAKVYKKNRKYKKAYQTFIKCIELDILHIGGNIQLGKYYQRKKDYDISEVHYFCALESNPYDPKIHLMICKLYLKMKRIKLAKHHYDSALSLESSLRDLKIEGEIQL